MHSMSLFDKQNYSKIKNKQWISAYEVDTTEKPERRSNQRGNEQFCLLETLSYESIGHIDNSDIRIFPWVHIDVGHYFLFFLLGNKNLNDVSNWFMLEWSYTISKQCISTRTLFTVGKIYKNLFFTVKPVNS